MSTNHHVAIASGASAVNTTFNTPLGALDAKLTHTVSGNYKKATTTTTTVTTGLTWYAIASHEVSFTPAYTGQTFLCLVNVGNVYGSTGTSYIQARIVDGSDTTVLDAVIRTDTTQTAEGAALGWSGAFVWTAAAGDVGVTRKLKLYVTNGTNGATVSTLYVHLDVVTH